MISYYGVACPPPNASSIPQPKNPMPKPPMPKSPISEPATSAPPAQGASRPSLGAQILGAVLLFWSLGLVSCQSVFSPLLSSLFSS